MKTITDMNGVPAIVVFWTFLYGRPQTDWKGLQYHYHMSDELIARLKADNEAYRRLKKL